MTTSDRTASPALAAPRPYRRGSLLADWLSSTDHKVTGHLYLITSFGFFLVAGLMAMIMRSSCGRRTTTWSLTSSATSCSPCTARSCC